MLFDTFKEMTGSHNPMVLNQQVSVTQKKKRFESEAALVQAAKEIVIPVLGSEYGLADEFDCNDGIADLVLYRLRQNGQNCKGLQLLSPRWAAALYALPYRCSFTTEWFSEVNLVSKRRALLALREYEKAGFCMPMSKIGTWTKTRQPRPFASQICAVEAKLRDWRRALSQAARYRAFAHQAWVLLDDASVNPALVHLDRFVGLNVGLASISTDGTILRHHTPEKRLPSDPWRFWYANVLIARATMQSGGVGNTN